jgi:RNA polymerase sigma factor (TIGR02999 family)
MPDDAIPFVYSKGCTPSFKLSAVHHALRKRARRTVMALRDFDFLGPGEWSGTPAERRELDRLFSVTYEELRRLASSVRRTDPGATLSPTTLVNEAWLKLAGSPRFMSTSRLHFKRIAARAMRQVLIEAARRRNASKRGGRSLTMVTFDEATDSSAACGKELLALDSALEELARMNPRQAMMVESRFFGGLDVAEIAGLLEVSEATILRDWRAAKAWLAHELRRNR